MRLMSKGDVYADSGLDPNRAQVVEHLASHILEVILLENKDNKETKESLEAKKKRCQFYALEYRLIQVCNFPVIQFLALESLADNNCSHSSVIHPSLSLLSCFWFSTSSGATSIETLQEVELCYSISRYAWD